MTKNGGMIFIGKLLKQYKKLKEIKVKIKNKRERKLTLVIPVCVSYCCSIDNYFFKLFIKKYEMINYIKKTATTTTSMILSLYNLYCTEIRYDQI